MLELTFIRQVPAEVPAIAYFTNLLLMASFFGLGVGCILQRRRSLGALLPVGLILVAGLIYVGRGIVVYEESAAVQYWFQYQEVPKGAVRLPLFPAAATAFVFGALPFVALGQILAQSMDRHPRLVAYGWDIAGSLVGTLAFTLTSFLGVPPWVWPPILTLLWAVYVIDGWQRRAVWMAAGASFLGFADTAYEWQWSPYYLIQYQKEAGGLRMWSNSNFLQYAVDFGSADPWQRENADSLLAKWGRLYEVYRDHNEGRAPRRVLVLGAGTGNDVHVARHNGAQSIVAVEIDATVLDVGRRASPVQPYSLEDVVTHVDDARHFLRVSEDEYDLIAFATIDSVALLTGHSNLRLENYVYTAESLADARSLLADGGMVGVYYSVYRPWLRSRIYATARAAFGDAVQIHVWDDTRLFNTLVVGARDGEGFEVQPGAREFFSRGTVVTDDWPYLYVRDRTIAPVYRQLMAFVAVLIAGAFLLLRRIHPVSGLHANFLLLGLGFTLMQSSSIVRMSLVFGTTWLVNAVVFTAVLTTMFLGNALVMKGAAPSLRLSWLGLWTFGLLNYFFPLAWLFEVTLGWRALACGLLIGVPVFFASVCFSRLFRDQPVTGYPLGINLIGAMAGGLLEYASMAIGMRGIWIVVVVVYLLAWATTGAIARRGPTLAPGHSPGV